MASKRHFSSKLPYSPSASTVFAEEDAAAAKDGSAALESTQLQQQSLPATMESSEEGGIEDGGDDDGHEEEETAEKAGSAARELIHQPKHHHQISLSTAVNPELSGSDSDSSADGAPYSSRAAVSSIEPIVSRSMDGSSMIAGLPRDHQSQKRKREEDHKYPKGKNSRKGLVLQDGTPPKINRNSPAGLEYDDNKKRPMFQKLWSDEDVEIILCGMVEYRNKNGAAPASSQGTIPFLDFVQGRLQIKITKPQLQDKLRRLKKKFQKNAARVRKDADFIFSSLHDQICYELSKFLWDSKEKKPKDKVLDKKTAEDENRSGSNKDQDTKKKSKSIIGVSKQSGSLPNKYEDTTRSNLQFPYFWGSVNKLANELSCGVAIMKSFHELNTEKASALDEKVKKLKMKEIKLHMRKMDLVKDIVKLIHDGLSAKP